MADLEKERMDYERGQVIGVSCPKCGERNLILLDMRIEGFTCKKCGQKSKLFYEFRAESIFDLRREEFTKGQIAAKLKEDVGASMKIWDSLGDMNG
jgi:transposase-like protein